ncbi:MAG: PH domain-containing protein [Vicinamibacterales bacterium]
MPSEHRLHPATLLFDLARHARNFALPAVLLIFGVSRSSGGPGGMFGAIPEGWEVWLPILFVPAAAVSVTRYLTFRWRCDERELVIRWGLLFRHERHVPYARIQNVDAVQNAFHRLFSVVEVRVETGGGKEEEARLSVLPRAAFDEIRSRVFSSRPAHAEHAAPPVPAEHSEHPEHPEHPGPPAHPVPTALLHLNLRELLLFGFLENKGMVVIGAAFGAGWETGWLDRLLGRYAADGPLGRGFFRDLFRAVFGDGPLPLAPLWMALAGIVAFLVVVRLVSMGWALARLYGFRLTRMDEDLRTQYGLITRVSATVPIRRVQTINIRTGLLHRWLGRASVRVETAGGAGEGSAAPMREWLAPLIRVEALPPLLQQVLPGFDYGAVTWQRVHPRAFRRAMKKVWVFLTVLTLLLATANGWVASGVLLVLLPWLTLSTHMYVQHLGWVEGDEVVLMKSGWIWRQVTVARINKIQVVAMHQSPFDRRAAMARVKVDTAGAGEFSHRVDIPYLDQRVAQGLADRLSAAAANTAFRW